MGRMGLESILPITIGTVIKLDGDGVGMCKQALRVWVIPKMDLETI